MILRSASQKNFASRSRAVTTRSAFFAISRSSDGCVFTTARNASFSSPRVGHHRKEVLVMHERGRQHFLRQLQEAALEEAGDDAGELDQVGDLVDERRLLAQVDAAAQLPRLGFQLARDAIAALGVIEDDEVLRQARPVLVEGPHLDRPPGASARGEEAMAVGHRAGRDRPAPACPRRSASGRW